MSRRATSGWAAAVAVIGLGALTGCLPAANSADDTPQCATTADCNATAGEVCDVGVCWGDPPAGRFAAVVAPPAGQRGTLVKTAIPDVTITADGTLGGNGDQALSLDPAVTVAGVVTIPCPAGVAACAGALPLAGQLRFTRPAAFPGGPRLSESAEVAADGSYQVALARPRVGVTDTYAVTFTPSSTPLGPNQPSPAMLLAPVAVDLELTRDDMPPGGDPVVRDLAFDPASQKVMTGQIVRALPDSPVAGWQVVAEVLATSGLGARQVVSTTAITDDAGAFALRLPNGPALVDVLVSPPPSASADHRPSVRVRDVVVGDSIGAIDVPVLGVPEQVSIEVRGTDTAGATIAVDGATVVVRLEHALGGGRALSLETRTTTVNGTASLTLFPVWAGNSLPYSIDVLPAPGSDLAARYDTAVTFDGSALTIALPRRIPVVGRVVDFRGLPVIGASVTAAVATATLCTLSSDDSRIALAMAPAQVTTDTKGEFTVFVDGDLAGTRLTYDVTVRPSDGDPHPTWMFPSIAPAADTRAELTLPDAAWTRGLVLGASQGPVAGASVSIYELLDEAPTCVSSLGGPGLAVVRGRGEADELGTAVVVLPRP
ncbi:MAG: hypothetical protein R3B06_19435 [Kofleriaceae bacterium]